MVYGVQILTAVSTNEDGWSGYGPLTIADCAWVLEVSYRHYWLDRYKRIIMSSSSRSIFGSISCLSFISINRKILYKFALSCLFRILINVSITCINSCKQNFLKFAITKRAAKYKSCRFKLCQLIIHSCLYLLFTLHLFHNRTTNICKNTK